MTITAIDTHEVVKELKAAGFSDDQAEAVTRVVRRAQDIDFSNLATRSDLDVLRAATKTDIDALRASTKADLRETELRLEAKIEAVRSDLVKWMFGAIGFQTIVTIGAVFAIARMLAH